MMNATATHIETAAQTLVVGLGATGLSCARFLAARGESFAVIDSRSEPPGIETLRSEMPEVETYLGPFDAELLAGAGRIILSPGISPHEPAIAAAVEAGVELLGDIELFARHVDAPVAAITGSNGKSTVTTLLGEMAEAAGVKVAVGGNIGTPALDLLGQGAELYVLELSSFQLEVTQSLQPKVATVLNISADHLDRHGDLINYAEAKRHIFRGDGVMVLNADDFMVGAMCDEGRDCIYFTTGEPESERDYGLHEHAGRRWLCRGDERLVATDELRISGLHNYSNALAALAMGEVAGLRREAMVEALKQFKGLSHRCQWVAESDGVTWFNDSKGTNIGATEAALAGLEVEKVVLIAGGQGKGQAFDLLREPVLAHARAVVLIGEDAALIEQALHDTVPLHHAATMADAVQQAADLAQPGDAVLLSPACASFDMFSGYVARGEAFEAAVREVCHD